MLPILNFNLKEVSHENTPSRKPGAEFTWALLFPLVFPSKHVFQMEQIIFGRKWFQVVSCIPNAFLLSQHDLILISSDAKKPALHGESNEGENAKSSTTSSPKQKQRSTAVTQASKPPHTTG